jgi:hyperosmotically inducible periplasmic protein
MKLTKGLLAVAIAATIGFTSCGPKDADIKAEIDKSIQANADMTGLTATVSEGVVTLNGTCKDEDCKTNCVKAVEGMKGVKSVVSNITLPAPPPPPVEAPASVTTVLDEATQQKVKDGLKDIPGVTVTFEGDRAVLTGEVSKENRMKIMKMLSRANVKFDPNSKLTDKK